MWSTLSAFAARIGITGAIIAALVALLAIQTIRLEGLRIWPISIEGARPKAQRLTGELHALIKAQEAAGKAQQAVNDAKQKDYDNATKRSTETKPIIDIAVRDATDRYADANRVRPEAGHCTPGGTDSAAQSGGAGVDADLSTDRLVSVSEPDLRALSDATAYAVACRAFVLDLGD